MNKEEMFKGLHLLLTGVEGKKDSTLSSYERQPPERALRRAENYLKEAQRGQDNCQSDWAYWGYEGDISRAKVLIAVFKAINEGITDFPNLPKNALFLIDKTYNLEQWAKRVERMVRERAKKT